MISSNRYHLWNEEKSSRKHQQNHDKDGIKNVPNNNLKHTESSSQTHRKGGYNQLVPVLGFFGHHTLCGG